MNYTDGKPTIVSRGIERPDVCGKPGSDPAPFYRAERASVEDALHISAAEAKRVADDNAREAAPAASPYVSMNGITREHEGDTKFCLRPFHNHDWLASIADPDGCGDPLHLVFLQDLDEGTRGGWEIDADAMVDALDSLGVLRGVEIESLDSRYPIDFEAETHPAALCKFGADSTRYLESVEPIETTHIAIRFDRLSRARADIVLWHELAHVKQIERFATMGEYARWLETMAFQPYTMREAERDGLRHQTRGRVISLTRTVE